MTDLICKPKKSIVDPEEFSQIKPKTVEEDKKTNVAENMNTTEVKKRKIGLPKFSFKLTKRRKKVVGVVGGVFLLLVVLIVAIGVLPATGSV